MYECPTQEHYVLWTLFLNGHLYLMVNGKPCSQEQILKRHVLGWDWTMCTIFNINIDLLINSMYDCLMGRLSVTFVPQVWLQNSKWQHVWFAIANQNETIGCMIQQLKIVRGVESARNRFTYITYSSPLVKILLTQSPKVSRHWHGWLWRERELLYYDRQGWTLHWKPHWHAWVTMKSNPCI